MQILEISIEALELAKQAAAAGLPIPGLSLAIESALSIAKKAKEIEDTRDDCRALAERAATFVLTVYQQLKHGSGETAGKEHVTTFLHNLLDIENLMVRRLRAGRIQRVLFALKRGKIAKEVKTLTAKLEDSYRHFMIQAALAIDQSMNTLTSGNIRMMRHIDDSARVGEVVLGETRVIRTDLSDLAHHVGGSATFDGDFRLFARENLALLEPIVDSLPHGDEYTIVQAAAQPPTGRVFRYRAVVEAAGNLTGTQVVVYEYPSRDDRQFVEAVKFAKRTRHPHLLAMLGYSRSGNPGEAAYIVTEDYFPFAEHVRSLRGISQLRAYLQMEAAICMVVDHMEATGINPRQLLPTATYWDRSAHFHRVGLAEVIFDPRHGGHIKWTWDPLVLETPDSDLATPNTVEVPAAQQTRTSRIEDLRAVASARADTVVQHWLSKALNPIKAYYGFVLGRSWRTYWEHVIDSPQYPLGVWLGRDGHEPWTCLSAQDAGFRAAVTMQRIPLVLPPPKLEGRGFEERLRMSRWFTIPKADLGEMCIEYVISTAGDQTRWTRYQFSCVSVPATFLYQQHVHALDGIDTASRMMSLLPDLSAGGRRYTQIGTATQRTYFTETIVFRTAETVVPPLWFFVLQYDGVDVSPQDYVIPAGFWSLEKDPTSIPTDTIAYAPSQYFEPLHEVDDQIFVTVQALGDLKSITWTRMNTELLQLSEDELSAFRELKESHH